MKTIRLRTFLTASYFSNITYDRYYKVAEVIAKLPQPEQYYHRLLIKDHLNQKQLFSLQKWMEQYCNFNSGQIYNKYNLIALIMSTSQNRDQHKFGNWQHWSFNLFVILYCNSEKQLEINPSEYFKFYSSLQKIKIYTCPSHLYQSITQYKEPQLTGSMVLILSNKFKEYILHNQQNRKVMNRSRNRYLDFLLKNIKHIKEISGLKSLFYDIIAIHNGININEKVRNTRLISAIEHKIIEMSGKDRDFMKKLVGGRFVFMLLKIYDMNSYIPHPSLFKIINSFIHRLIDHDLHTFDDPFKRFITLFRHFPFWIEELNGKLIYHRKNIMIKFYDKVIQNSTLLKAYQSYDPVFLEIYTIYVVNTYLYQPYMQLSTSTVNGFFVINEKPKLPDINMFHWKVYNKVGKKHRYRNQTMLNLFKNHYMKFLEKSETETNRLQIDKERPQIFQQYLSNEAGYIVSLALNKLKYKIESESKVNGLVTDFVVDDEIIVECDGDSHLMYNKMETSQKTALRNMIHMINGYKVVTINMLEVNQYRNNIDQLAQVIEAKLQTAKQQDIYYVE